MRLWIIKFYLTLILVLTLSSLTLADTGCFLEQDSDLYCQQINYDEAEFECSLYDCNIGSTFLESKQCSIFEECEEILCQSSCEYQLAGTCSSGPVPTGEEELWCSGSGCCRFWPSGVEPTCYIDENKWSCHIAASNAGADSLDWDTTIDSTSCEESCLADSYSYSAQLDDYDLNYYSPESISYTETEETEITSTTSNSSPNQSSESIPSKLIHLLAPFFLLFVGLLLTIFFYEHRHTFIKDYNQIKEKLVPKKKSTKPPIAVKHEFIQPAPEPLSEIPSHYHHHKPTHHKQHIQWELAENFGSYKPVKLENKSGIQKLQSFVNRYNRKILRRKRSKDKLNQKLSR